MAGKHENLLTEYDHSDFNKRLHLFLEYPELRRDFLRIDQGQERLSQEKRTNNISFQRSNMVSLIVGSITGYFKKAVF